MVVVQPYKFAPLEPGLVQTNLASTCSGSGEVLGFIWFFLHPQWSITDFYLTQTYDCRLNNLRKCFWRKCDRQRPRNLSGKHYNLSINVTSKQTMYFVKVDKLGSKWSKKLLLHRFLHKTHKISHKDV